MAEPAVPTKGTAEHHHGRRPPDARSFAGGMAVSVTGSTIDWTTCSIASRRIACCALSVRWTAFAVLFGPFGVVATTSPTIVKADQSFAAAKHTSVAAILISLILAIWRYEMR
jgi:hypothetical protein